ncbi:MAG TPA: hypothetical protein VJO53_07810 [Candidatus Acidoferrales bacterium]|nr:hypothetical protein [Candidatus Acidoferrales bacterium]
MRKTTLVSAILILGVSISWTLGAEPAAAQGPAGAGASVAAQESSHSLNPIKWVKKDSKNSAGTLDSRNEAEKKLTPGLQAKGVLAANMTAIDACAQFTALDGCLATLHASHNLGLDFSCLRANVTGVHTSLDMSRCKVADGDKPQGLNKAIRQLKPDANVKQATKEAEQQAKDDLKGIGG